MKPWHVKTRVSRGATGNARWTLRNALYQVEIETDGIEHDSRAPSVSFRVKSATVAVVYDAFVDEAFVYWNGTGARLQLELRGFAGLTFIDTPGADAPCMTFADARKAVAAFVDALNTFPHYTK